MAISESTINNILFKKVIFGVTQTSETTKSPANETIPSPLVIFNEDVLFESQSIPRPAQSLANVVEDLTGSMVIECSADSTVAIPNKTWIAVSNPALNEQDPANQLIDWISPVVDPSYQVRVYAGDPNLGGTQLIQDAANQEWYFDYKSGVLYFPNNIPSVVAGDSIFIEGYRYIGRKGIDITLSDLDEFDLGSLGPSDDGKILVYNGTTGVFDLVNASANNTLGVPTDGVYTDGFFQWVPNTTTIDDAFDDVNELLALLAPDPPPDLSTKSISISGAVNSRGGNNILLADGFTDNTSGASGLVRGQQVFRTGSSSPQSNIVTEFGRGQQGTLTGLVNGTVSGTIALTSGNDVGSNGSLTITDEVDFPASTPGLFTALDARVSSAAPVGVNSFGMTHTDTGSAQTAFFVRDDLISSPSIANFSITEITPGTFTYSSGIPHYNNGATIGFSADVSNLAGQTYLSDNLVRFTTVPAISATEQVGPGEAPLPLFLFVNHPTVNFTNFNIPLSGTAHSTSDGRLLARNPHGDSSLSIDNTIDLLYMQGTPSSGVIEAGRSMSGSVLKRWPHPQGGRPASPDPTSFATASFDSGTTPGGGDAAQNHEAIIRGGVLRSDQTDYTAGFLPVGPNYTSRDSTQYATFIIQRIANNMTVVLSGSTPLEFWVKLPGIPQATPNATNGWWDALSPATFPPGEWPGSPNDTGDGCRSGGTGNTFNITFGSASSAGATDNIVMVRFALSAGQAVNNITITIPS